MASTRFSGVIAAAVLAMTVALAGCASPAPEDTSPPTGTPDVSSSPEPSSPAPSPVAPEPDPGDPSTWIIGDTGVGPVRIGGDFASTLGGLPEAWTNDPANCGWTAWLSDADAGYGVFFVRGTESDSDPISEISVYSTTDSTVSGAPVTREGLGIGASREEVRATYPDAQQGEAQIGGGTWIRLAGAGESHVFFGFREGEEFATTVTVTTRVEPSYEVCG